jgi:hypothetical protein
VSTPGEYYTKNPNLSSSIDNNAKEFLNPHTLNDLKENIKWSWACRIINYSDNYIIEPNSRHLAPNVGDVALLRVEELGYHKSLVISNNKRSRLYEGDIFVGVFGNRYATQYLEAEVRNTANLSMLTASGMVGTVISKHKDFGKITNLSFIGFLTFDNGQRVNLKIQKSNEIVSCSSGFSPNSHSKDSIKKHLLVVVGTGMNSGKTTTASKLIKGLSKMGIKVAACKLTGSVSNRDMDEMLSASANTFIDFSDYGFPSTYLCSKKELLDLFNTMVITLEKTNPDIIIMEIADGILQRETTILLKEESVKSSIKGIIVTAESPLSALYAVENLSRDGYNILSVSGTMTSSPLLIKEFQKNSKIKVTSSDNFNDQLIDILKNLIECKV